MNLKQLLSGKKPVILEKWFDLVIETYPAETARFLKGQANRFQNPVGHAIGEALEKVLDQVLSKDKPANTEEIVPFLDTVIRVRAVQDFTARDAVSFVLALKGVVREAAAEEIRANNLHEELFEIDSAIDDVVLVCFDIYMGCRERIYDLKAEETKRSVFRLLQQAKLISGAGEEETDPEAS